MHSSKDSSQNRLLIATAVLTFIYYAGAEFHGLTVAGAAVTFSNKHAVLEFTWVIWGYYYMRCYQYYKKLGIQNFRASLNESYIASFGHRLVNLKRHEFDLLPDDDSIKSSIVRLGWHITTVRERRLAIQSDFLAPLPIQTLTSQRTRFNFIRKHNSFLHLLDSTLFHFRRTIETRVRLSGFRAVIYPPSDRDSLKGQRKHTVSLPFWMPILVLWVYIRTIVARPEFIENQGPLVLGLVPVWGLIFRDWHRIGEIF